jgi:hypothetical protein
MHLPILKDAPIRLLSDNSAGRLGHYFHDRVIDIPHVCLDAIGYWQLSFRLCLAACHNSAKKCIMRRMGGPKAATRSVCAGNATELKSKHSQTLKVIREHSMPM